MTARIIKANRVSDVVGLLVCIVIIMNLIMQNTDIYNYFVFIYVPNILKQILMVLKYNHRSSSFTIFHSMATMLIYLYEFERDVYIRAN